MSDEGSLQSTLQSVDRWNGTWEDAGGERADLVREYLPLFYATFPQAGKRLIPAALDEDDARGGVRLTPTALMELDTIFENERLKTPQDDMATYVRCFAGLKRLWRV